MSFKNLILALMLLTSAFTWAQDPDHHEGNWLDPRQNQPIDDAEYEKMMKDLGDAMIKLASSIAQNANDPKTNSPFKTYQLARASAIEFIRMVLRKGESDRMVDYSGRVWTKAELIEVLEQKLLEANAAREIAIKKGFLDEVYDRDFGRFFDIIEEHTHKSITSDDPEALVKQMKFDGVTDHGLTMTREDIYYISWATFIDSHIASEYEKRAEDFKVRYEAVLRAIERSPEAVAAYEHFSHQPFGSLKLPLMLRKHMTTQEFLKNSCRAFFPK